MKIFGKISSYEPSWLFGNGGSSAELQPSACFCVQFALFIPALMPCTHFAQEVATNLKPLRFGFTVMKHVFCIYSLLAWKSAIPYFCIFVSILVCAFLCDN